MGNNDKKKPWYVSNLFLAIYTITSVFIGFLISQVITEGWLKSNLPKFGVIVSFFGFLLMLFSGFERQPSATQKNKYIKFFSKHPATPSFWVGLGFVFLGFICQTLGIEKSLF